MLLCLLPVLACGPKKSPTTTPEPQGEAVEPAAPVDPIPDDLGALTPQLVVVDIPTALDFYGKAFGAQTLYTINGPDGAPMHAEIKIGDSVLMIDSVQEGMKDPMALGGSPVTLMLYVEDADAAFATATEAGAVVNMPLEDMFWGDRYGQLVDPFGHAWAVATHMEDLTDEQMQQRMELLPPPPKKGKKTRKPKKGKAPKWASVEGTPAAQKVPEGYHSVTMSLTVSDAAKAIEFYTTVFGATERSRMPTADGRLLHAELDIGGDVLMLADEFPEMGGTSAATLGGSPVTIHHYVEDAEATFAKATDNGATAVMPLAVMFWGDRMGAVVDPVGFPWSIATHVEDVPPEQMEERMKAQMAAEGAAGGDPTAEGAEDGEGAEAEGDDEADEAEPEA